MSWLHNRPTMPTFLPCRTTKEEITTIDIEACYQEYRTFRWDICERYSFQEYLVMYGLRNNQQSTSMEETKESPSSVGGEVEKVL